MNRSTEYFENVKSSYITKEEFIKMLETLDFKAIETFDMKVITEFYIEVNEEEEPRIKKIGFHIGGS